MALGVRSYSNSLLLQNVFNLDAIPNTDPILRSFANKILNPTMPCTEIDCETTIGRRMDIPDTDYEVLGLIALDTNAPIDDPYLVERLTAGNYFVRTRDTGNCLTENGFCRLCGRGYGARVGVTLNPAVGSSYALTGDTRGYMNYLAGTYSGALLGYEQLGVPVLPTIPENWSLITSHAEMDRLVPRLRSLRQNIDENDYLYTIEDILERALAIIAYYGVYGSVT